METQRDVRTPEGKIAFISGTGRYGIGQVVAKLFAAEGAKIFGCARHNETYDETSEAVKSAGRIMRQWLQ
jgi:meso-butanediol dehydrogenase / (S,S)-butanediol dehydrogenase / diacetyl reductase